MIEVFLLAMLSPEPAAVAAAATPRPSEVADVEADDEKEICRRKFDATGQNGTMVKARKVCKTASEWAAESAKRR